MRYILSVINRPLRSFLLLLSLACAANVARAESYKYFRLGNKEDVQTKPVAGIAMMGGGDDLDEAFRWLCNKGNGGDFLILRARGDDDYNSYVNGVCRANSVATLIIPDRQAAGDPAVAEIIRKAEVVFIAGGDQAKAKSALLAAEPELMRAAQRGVIHKKTASRKVSRLTHQIGKLGK